MPCPATSWAYSDSFATYNSIAEWLNVVGLILLTFMLLSYVVLPTQKTRSHYLSVCLIVAVIMICLGFTIPLGANPEQCYDQITPNDMYSSMGCAWSGAFIVAGGLSAAMWQDCVTPTANRRQLPLAPSLRAILPRCGAAIRPPPHRPHILLTQSCHLALTSTLLVSVCPSIRSLA